MQVAFFLDMARSTINGRILAQELSNTCQDMQAKLPQALRKRF